MERLTLRLIVGSVWTKLASQEEKKEDLKVLHYLLEGHIGKAKVGS
jgi:hypothetical protein